MDINRYFSPNDKGGAGSTRNSPSQPAGTQEPGKFDKKLPQDKTANADMNRQPAGSARTQQQPAGTNNTKPDGSSQR
jgi:hypothetical protein